MQWMKIADSPRLAYWRVALEIDRPIFHSAIQRIHANSPHPHLAPHMCATSLQCRHDILWELWSRYIRHVQTYLLEHSRCGKQKKNNSKNLLPRTHYSGRFAGCLKCITNQMEHFMKIANCTYRAALRWKMRAIRACMANYYIYMAPRRRCSLHVVRGSRVVVERLSFALKT